MPQRIQLELVGLNYKSLTTFGLMAEDSAGFRAAIKSDLLDTAEAGLAIADIRMARLYSTQLVAAWLSASKRVAEEIRVTTDSKALRLPTMLTALILLNLRKRYEVDHGRITDHVWPCAALIERHMDQVEEGHYVPIPLTEVVSLEKCSDEHTTLTEIGANVRVRKSPKSIALPSSTEELRTRFETLAITFEVVAYKHVTRLWLKTATAAFFLTYVKYLLSDEVSNSQHDTEGISVTATWATVLSYEFQMRKLAARSILYDGMDFAAAMTLAMKDLNCKERWFITPTAINSAMRKPKPGKQDWDSSRGGKDKGGKGDKKRKADSKGGKGGKGEGKGKGKNAQKQGKSSGKLVWKQTPDERYICAYHNTTTGCTKGDSCPYLHICQKCLDPSHICLNNNCITVA